MFLRLYLFIPLSYLIKLFYYCIKWHILLYNFSIFLIIIVFSLHSITYLQCTKRNGNLLKSFLLCLKSLGKKNKYGSGLSICQACPFLSDTLKFSIGQAQRPVPTLTPNLYFKPKSDPVFVIICSILSTMEVQYLLRNS